MPSFAVFFSDEAAVGMTRVEASDAAAAEALVLEQHPGGRAHAVDGAPVSEENRVRMLGAWLREAKPFGKEGKDVLAALRRALTIDS